MVDEQLWKRRFLLFSAARLFGLAMFFAGIAIAFSDVVRDGGWPTLGGILAVMGVLDAVFAPKLMKAAWDREDRTRR